MSRVSGYRTVSEDWSDEIYKYKWARISYHTGKEKSTKKLNN